MMGPGDVGRLVAPLARRMQNLIARAVVKVIADGLKMQELQVAILSGEVKDGIEHPQAYGFTAHPHPGAEAFVVFLGGGRDHGVVLVVDDRRYRLKPLEQGEVAIYTDEDRNAPGHRIVLKRNNLIEVACKDLVVTAAETVTVTAGVKITLTAPELVVTAKTTITGDVAIDGVLSVSKDVNAGGAVMDASGNSNHHSH